MATHRPSTQEVGIQTFDTQEASTQTEETTIHETSTPETGADETSKDETPKRRLAKHFLIPFIARLLLHIPTVIVGAWSISTYQDALFWADDFSAAPYCLSTFQAVRLTGIVGFIAFAWNFIQFLPSVFAQGLAQGIIGIVDMALVLALFTGVMMQAASLSQTCDSCPVTKSFGTPENTMFNDLSDWCGDLSSTVKVAVLVTCLYSICAVANIWLGFRKARRDAKLEQSTPTDLWIANKVSVVTLPVWRLIGISAPGAGKTFESFENESTAEAEETIGLMHQKRDNDGTELSSLSRLSGDTEDGSEFPKRHSTEQVRH
ncbi:hypothetical protein AK830_g12031 [Neonectria ditissima]|uniref:Uncharacterized protein n=1 Tax=Neonectria ditissima TaxID=78410 RepID=A0A0P7AZY9_9HYPO|nr:hypothetical protein AK830_g12031 [Neonectria ditissima]